MSNEHAAAAPAHAHEHHIVPTITYIKTILSLVVLMVATVLIAVYVQFPSVGFISGTVLNQGVALIIACAKAFLVITIFMGVKWVTPLTRMWAMTGFVWFTLIYMILGDYISRQYEPLPGWTQDTYGKTIQNGMQRTSPNSNPTPMVDPNDANIHERD